MELKFINYIYKDGALNLTIPAGTILGVTGANTKDLLSTLALETLSKGEIQINDITITKENIDDYRKKISYIKDDELPFFETTVSAYMTNYIKMYNLEMKDPVKKIKDSLKIVGLAPQLLEKNPNELASSEKKLLSLAASLLSNPEILIIEEPFKKLDKLNEKRIAMLLIRLKEQFKKTIIIASTDANMLYKYTTEMLFIKNNQIFLSGPTTEVYLRVDYLKRNKFAIPDIVEFTYIAKKKKEVKIDYHKDVRDIIKDIYKHI